MEEFSKPYLDLVDKVRAVDRDAANWLLEETCKIQSFDESDELVDCFIWADTPQGHCYWSDIQRKIA